MSFSQPTTLGIVSCPGGENFASEIVSHLKSIYREHFDQKAGHIAHLYGLSREEVCQKINLADDLTSHRVAGVGPSDSFRPPSFDVPCTFTRFPNGEFKAAIKQSIRHKDIFIVQDVSNASPVSLNGNGEKFLLSVNDHLFTLFVTIDAVLQSGARSISLVLPTYPYSRQHKRQGREGLTASSIGRILEGMGANRIITLDLHSHEIEHTFKKLSLENLQASYQIFKVFIANTSLEEENLVVVAPDTGGVLRNKFYASCLKRPLALFYKERDYSRIPTNADKSNIQTMRLLGRVRGKTVFMADDMLGTGGTLIKSMRWLRDRGNKKFIAAISLPIFSGDAIENFDKAHREGLFDYIIVTNAVYLSKEVLERPWLKMARVSKLFAQAIFRIHHQMPVSQLLDSRARIQKLLKKSASSSR